MFYYRFLFFSWLRDGDKTRLHPNHIMILYFYHVECKISLYFLILKVSSNSGFYSIFFAKAAIMIIFGSMFTQTQFIVYAHALIKDYEEC